MQAILLKIRYFERELSKSLKNALKLYFFFGTQSLLMDKIMKNKRGLKLQTSRYSGYKTSSARKIPSSVLYYLNNFDNIIKSNFLIISRTKSANLCKPIHDIINYSTSICPFESGKCGKEGKKLQKFEYLKNEKSFFNEIKNIFYSF